MSMPSTVPSKSNVKIQPRSFTIFAMVKCKPDSKYHFFRPSWSLAMHSLFDHICSCFICFQQRYAYLLSQDNIHGQIHLQPKTTALHELTRGLIPSKASFPTEQNDDSDVKLKFYSSVIDLDIKLLPGQRLSLDNRAYLDVGYDDINFIPNDIKNLSIVLLSVIAAVDLGMTKDFGTSLWEHRFGRLSFCFHACLSSCYRNLMSRTESCLLCLVKSYVDCSRGTLFGNDVIPEDLCMLRNPWLKYKLIQKLTRCPVKLTATFGFVLPVAGYSWNECKAFQD
ncbi:hypothetical protein Nmel_002546 [Mimus melanotis]